jgi:iron complex outermembrane receptor protein
LKTPQLTCQTVTIPAALVVWGLCGFLPASADDDQPSDLLTLEPIQVTGTRITRKELEASAPITLVDRQDIERMGTTDIGELLQTLPMMSGSPLSSGRNVDGDVGESGGGVALDLRGLGSQRTLVLVNGHRLPSQLNDLSIIPVVMVERVEILKAGGSTIYGADAVSGVVNIITRRDFEGATLNLQTGESFDLDGRNSAASFIWGHNFSRGNLVIGVEYSKQKAVVAGDYDEPWLRTDVSIPDPNEFRQYGFLGDPWTDLDGNGIEGWVDWGSSRIPYGNFDLSNWNPEARSWTICQDSEGGGSLTTDYGPAGGCGPFFYNFANSLYIQTPYERGSLFIQSDFALTEATDAYLEGRYSNRQSEQNLAPQVYDSLISPGYASIEPGVAISKDNYYNPFGADILRWRRRVVEAGDRRFTQDVDQWQIVAGVRGDFAGTWNWNVSYNHGKRDRSDLRIGEWDATRLPHVLGPSFLDPASSEVVCGTPENPIVDCVSLNAFTNPDTNPISQEMVDWISIPLRQHYETKRQVLNLSFTGVLTELASGPLFSAVGVERRKESYVRTPDSENIDKSGNPEWGETIAGSYTVNSAFAELNIPLLTGKANLPLLEIDLSGRYDDFSTGDSAPTWQAALRWRPVQSLLLRATAGRVYREPNVIELFAAQSEALGLAADPCSGIGGTPGGIPGSGECEDVPADYFQFDPEVRVVVGGNSELTAEKGNNYTAGLAWTPGSLPGLSATLDWWRIDIDDAIAQPGASIVLAGCFAGASAEFCDRISRFGPESVFWGALEQVEVFTQNVGPEHATGIDWSLDYAIDSSIGLWGFSWFGTWNIDRESLVLRDSNADGIAEAVLTDLTGRFEHRSLTRQSAYPEWRWRLDTDWAMGNWGASLTINYISDLTECGTPFADPYWLTVYCPDDPQIVAVDAADTFYGVPLIDRVWENTVDATWYFDLSLSYYIPRWGTQLMAGITNLTDEGLPFFQQGDVASSDGDTFRTMGRTWFARIRQDF